MKISRMYAKAGYTHIIKYKENKPRVGVVQSQFPTTQDALKIHLENMRKHGLCFDIVVEPIKN